MGLVDKSQAGHNYIRYHPPTAECNALPALHNGATLSGVGCDGTPARSGTVCMVSCPMGTATHATITCEASIPEQPWLPWVPAITCGQVADNIVPNCRLSPAFFLAVPSRTPSTCMETCTFTPGCGGVVFKDATAAGGRPPCGDLGQTCYPGRSLATALRRRTLMQGGTRGCPLGLLHGVLKTLPA